MTLKAEIESLVRARSEATINGDLELLDRLLTSDFSYVNRWGDVVLREAYFQRKKISSSDSYWIAQDIDEFKLVPIRDDAVIARFRVMDHQMYEGEEMKDYVRTSYVCIRDKGVWKLMFGQTSPVEPE